MLSLALVPPALFPTVDHAHAPPEANQPRDLQAAPLALNETHFTTIATFHRPESSDLPSERCLFWLVFDVVCRVVYLLHISADLLDYPFMFLEIMQVAV